MLDKGLSDAFGGESSGGTGEDIVRGARVQDGPVLMEEGVGGLVEGGLGSAALRCAWECSMSGRLPTQQRMLHRGMVAYFGYPWGAPSELPAP